MSTKHVVLCDWCGLEHEGVAVPVTWILVSRGKPTHFCCWACAFCFVDARAKDEDKEATDG